MALPYNYLTNTICYVLFCLLCISGIFNIILFGKAQKATTWRKIGFLGNIGFRSIDLVNEQDQVIGVIRIKKEIGILVLKTPVFVSDDLTKISIFDQVREVDND